MTDAKNLNDHKSLEGIRVLEMGQMLAGPFASTLMAWFGADVIKVEPPRGGDPIRTWRGLHNGTALWWYILGRNKKCITIDLHQADGQALVRQLAQKVDVVIENFKPGTMEKWGLGYEDLKRLNPRLIMARVSGWGQTGPKSPKPGFASVAEGVGGLRYVNGYPDLPPVRPNLSLGDTIAGLTAAFGILAAVHYRDVVGTGVGQVVDVAIYESIFNLLEGAVPEYDKLGLIRERTGTTLSGIVPTGTYPCKEGKFVIIGANSDSIFKRLCNAMGRSEMGSDTRFSHNDDRVTHQQEIEKAIVEWTSKHTLAEVQESLELADVPVGPIYSVADMLRDPHFIARGLFEDSTLPDGSTVKLPIFTPKLTESPGRTEWIGPSLGAHNREVLGGWLGLSDETLTKLASEGTIAPLEAPVVAD
jgi:crotonobetainyl-CoA:carnitine CoA-transferase CaiB-like acyl-CoA transferase